MRAPVILSPVILSPAILSAVIASSGLLALAACSPAEAPKPAAAASASASAAPGAAPSLDLQGPYAACGAVTAAGWCGLAFGEAAAGAETRAKTALIPQITEATLHDPDACTVLTTADGPTSIAFISVGGKLGSVSIGVPGPLTAEGIGVDSKEADLRAKYPAAKAAPNKYEPAVTDYEVDSPPGRLVFEVEAGTVRRVKAGIEPSIEYVEGCG